MFGDLRHDHLYNRFSTFNWYIFILILIIVTLNLQKMGFRISHLNMRSLKNKIQTVTCLLNNENLCILAISETHLDTSVDDNEIAVSGYCVHTKDRNSYGGGVAIYIQSHIPVKLRADLMNLFIEMLRMEIHLPHTRPLLLGCCHRHPKAHIQICLKLQRASDNDREIYF